ncbi:Astrotactin-2 Precursor [Collichthys lucidus]|uniref:Astrotactin-2 n=1 Tax=Collichthys lucidus TaxID=240159 RepID=A0A4V6ARI0_COLLU|nr:Astrotactin-2 Precursor [Collichthys lucidus]
MARILLLRVRVLLVGLFLLTQTWTVRANRGAASPDEERDKESDAETPCEVKTVTVSTLPVLRENEFSFTGGASGNVVGGGGGGAGAAAAAAAGAGGGVGVGGGGTGGGTGGGGSGGGGESRLLLFVRTDLPGRISVMDDLDNTALPYFTLGSESQGDGTMGDNCGRKEEEITSQTLQAAPWVVLVVLRKEHMGLKSEN